MLMALGLTLILSIMGICSWRTARYTWWAPSRLLPGAYRPWPHPAIIVSMIVMGIVGILLERTLFRPHPGRDVVLNSIVISTGLTLMLTAAARDVVSVCIRRAFQG